MVNNKRFSFILHNRLLHA